MQGGPRRGRSPITGPALPHAAQASQTSPEGEMICPKGRRNQLSTAVQAKPLAAQASQLRRRAKLCARRAEKTKHPRRIGRTARRAGVPTSPEGETPCPRGRKNETSPPHRQNRTPGRRTPTPQGSPPYRFTGINNSKGITGFQSAGYSSKQGACSLSFQSPCAASHVWYMNM